MEKGQKKQIRCVSQQHMLVKTGRPWDALIQPLRFYLIHCGRKPLEVNDSSSPSPISIPYSDFPFSQPRGLEEVHKFTILPCGPLLEHGLHTRRASEPNNDKDQTYENPEYQRHARFLQLMGQVISRSLPQTLAVAAASCSRPLGLTPHPGPLPQGEREQKRRVTAAPRGAGIFVQP